MALILFLFLCLKVWIRSLPASQGEDESSSRAACVYSVWLHEREALVPSKFKQAPSPAIYLRRTFLHPSCRYS